MLVAQVLIGWKCTSPDFPVFVSRFECVEVDIALDLGEPALAFPEYLAAESVLGESGNVGGACKEVLCGREGARESKGFDDVWRC